MTSCTGAVAPDGRYERDGDELMRDRAGRAAVAASEGQAVGRHERRPHVASRSGRAARAGMTLVGPAPGTKADRTMQDNQTHPTRRAQTTPPRRSRAARGHPAGEAFGTIGDGGSAERFRAAGRDDTAARFGSANGTRAGRPTTPRHLMAEERRASRREDLVTGWCSLLLVLGLYLDGWSHGERAGGGLTLWHGVLYLGFAGTAAWILTRNQRRGAWSRRAGPAGYRLALVGVGLAMVAVAGDTVWHTLFGASQGLGQLISPFHLVLFAGACLLVSSALRAAWSGPNPARVPGLRAFWPVVLSTMLMVAMTVFFFQQVSALAAAGPSAGAPSGEPAQVYELTGLLAHNFLFLAPVLLLLLRWQTPLGTFTVMAGSVALLLATQTGLGLVGLVGAAVLGGTAADVTLALLMWPPAVPLTAWNRGRATSRSRSTPTPMPAQMAGR